MKTSFTLILLLSCFSLYECSETRFLTGSSCASNKYLYTIDNQCRDTCVAPYISSSTAGYLKCDYPCIATDFFYQDGTCAATCTPGFDYGTYTKGGKYCDPASYTSNGCTGYKYKMLDGSCADSCPQPLIAVGLTGSKQCIHPCSTGKYASINGTCVTSCDPGFVGRTEGSYYYCDYTATTSPKTLLAVIQASNPGTQGTTTLLFTAKYAMSLANFVSNNGRYLFTTQMAQTLGLERSSIAINSVTAGVSSTTTIEAVVRVMTSSAGTSAAYTVITTLSKIITASGSNYGMTVLGAEVVTATARYSWSIESTNAGGSGSDGDILYESNSKSSSSVSAAKGGIIAGVVVGAVAVIGLTGFTIYKCKKARRARQTAPTQNMNMSAGQAKDISPSIPQQPQQNYPSQYPQQHLGQPVQYNMNTTQRVNTTGYDQSVHYPMNPISEIRA